MAFFTELFARNRAPEGVRYRNALAMLGALSPLERATLTTKPADFPRIARSLPARGR